MNAIDRIKKICKERKIPISKLEKDLAFGNGYIAQLKKVPDDRLNAIANYLNVSMEYLVTGENSSNYSPELANLIIKIQKDKALVEALIKYFNFTDEQKKHIIDTINLLERV